MRSDSTKQGQAVLVVLCGRSFSGKSTIAKELAHAIGGEIVSLDLINEERGLVGGQGIPIDEWIRTNDEAARRVATMIASNRRVVVDDTSSPRFLRDGWRALATNARAAFVLVYVDTPGQVMRDRLLKNRGQSTRNNVIDEVMAEHLENFEPPQPDEEHIATSSGTNDLPTLLTEVRSSIDLQQA